MARHYNPSIAQRALRILNSKAGDTISDEVANLVAVLPIVPTSTEIYSSNPSTSASSSTAFTLPSDKDFYLTAVSYSIEKDATCDAADGQALLRAFANGSNRTIIGFPILTLTAQRFSLSLNLNPPLKVERGGTLTITAPTFTAGKFSRVGTFIGYYEEVTQT